MTRIPLYLALAALATLPSCRTTGINPGAFGAGMSQGYYGPPPAPAYYQPRHTLTTTCYRLTPDNTTCYTN